MTIINPPGVAAPRGFSHGMLAEGRILFVAGQIGWDARGTMVQGGFVEQFSQAMTNVLIIVRAAGGSPESIGRLTIFLVDKSEYAAARREIGERYRALMGRHFPAMTLVEVRSLLEPDARVEIEATAIIT
jgi:enamine deaminase RidA (YjgF/YER057c/UK114 family)